MNAMILNLIATFGILLQYFLEHFIEKKRSKRFIGFFILLFAAGGLWGGYYQQQHESDSIAKNLTDIKSQNDTLLIQVGNRDAAIKRIQAQNDSLRSEVTAISSVSPKLDPSGRIQLGPGVTLASEFEAGANQARDLFKVGKFEEAYKLAQSLSTKNSSFGLAYFIMGTIELGKANYPQGEHNLKKSIQLGLTKDDEAWAYHNLAVASIRQRRFESAIPMLEKSLAANPKMSESKQLLDQLMHK